MTFPNYILWFLTFAVEPKNHLQSPGINFPCCQSDYRMKVSELYLAGGDAGLLFIIS